MVQSHISAEFLEQRVPAASRELELNSPRNGNGTAANHGPYSSSTQDAEVVCCIRAQFPQNYKSTSLQIFGGSVLTDVISAPAAPARDTSTSAAGRSVADASVEADADGAPNADWGGALESDAPTVMSEATAVASMVVLTAGALESAEERAADAESEEAGTAAASMMAVTALKDGALESVEAMTLGGNGGRSLSEVIFLEYKRCRLFSSFL
ncbi:hypothetical protein C8J57DRAFT_1667293 [Mycena rebaudengoi]|nr:hypothetical protein C8J57DRAFT_1667293 [Mycena rebaudengoi]